MVRFLLKQPIERVKNYTYYLTNLYEHSDKYIDEFIKIIPTNPRFRPLEDKNYYNFKPIFYSSMINPLMHQKLFNFIDYEIDEYKLAEIKNHPNFP